MNSVEETQWEKLEEEWITLIMAAKQIGLTPDEVRKFIKENQKIKLIRPHFEREI